MSKSKKFLESMKLAGVIREEVDTAVADLENQELQGVEDEIDTDDDQVLAVLDMYFARISRKPIQVKANKLQQLVHRLINSMINMPRGEKEVRTALKLAIKGVNEKKSKVMESVEEGPSAMKFAKAIAKIESKPAATKSEMLSALVKEMTGIINNLPQSSRILRELAPIAMQIAMKGQTEEGTEEV